MQQLASLMKKRRKFLIKNIWNRNNKLTTNNTKARVLICDSQTVQLWRVYYKIKSMEVYREKRV